SIISRFPRRARADPAVGLKIMDGFTFSRMNQQSTVDLGVRCATLCFSLRRFSPDWVQNVMPLRAQNEIEAMGYRISNGPVVRLGRSDPKFPGDALDVVELPRVYGEPLLAAIGRDPR